jgi:hypothetical protein
MARTAYGPVRDRAAAAKRFKMVQQAKEEFWDRWVKEVFPSLLKQQKWFKYKRDASVGDLVLRKDETAAGQTYKYARITRVHAGSDGKVRAADIENKVPGESKFHSTTRPIHKLVLIVPVEKQSIEEEEEEPSDQDKGESTDQWPEEGGGNEEEHVEAECEGKDKEGLQEAENEEGQPVEAEANGGAGDEVQEEGTVSEVRKKPS